MYLVVGQSRLGLGMMPNMLHVPHHSPPPSKYRPQLEPVGVSQITREKSAPIYYLQSKGGV